MEGLKSVHITASVRCVGSVVDRRYAFMIGTVPFVKIAVAHRFVRIVVNGAAAKNVVASTHRYN